MAIRSGIGIGEAQVFDTSGLANQYARQVAADQKAQAAQAEIQRKASEKYNEELADLMANVKTEGARDNDVADITKAYNDIKDFYAQSAKLKDTDKPLFRSELRNRIKNLNEFAQRSNKLSKDLAPALLDMAQNEWEYDDSSVAEARRIFQTPLKQLGADAVIDPMKWKKLPKFSLIENILDKTYDLGKENAKFVGDVSVKGRTVGVSKVAPEFINAALIQSVQNSPEAKYALKSLYTKTTGDTQPTDEKLGSFLRQQYETRHRYDYEGSPQKVSTAGGESESEKKESKLLKERVSNIKSLVENKDQTVFEALKSSLPVNSKVKWLTTKGKVIGMQIDAPKSYDDEGNLISAISQRIDFTKGDPYKTINVIMNRYFGKKISNEALQSQGVGGNVRVNKIEPTTTNPVKFSAVQESAIARAIKDNPGVPRATIIKALGLQ